MGYDVMTSKKTYATRLDPDSAVAKKIEDSGNSAKFLEDTLNNVFADGHDPTKEKPLTQKIKEVQYAKLKLLFVFAMIQRFLNQTYMLNLIFVSNL